MRRPAAAEGVDREIARIVAGIDDDAADEVGGLLVLDGADGGGGVFDRHAQRRRDGVADRVFGGALRQFAAAAEKIIRVENAEHQIGVGHGRLGAAGLVAGRPRRGAGAARPDAQIAALIDPGDGAAAGADGGDIDGRDVDGVLVEDRRGRARRLAVDDQADQKGGAAEIGRDHLAVAEPVRQALRADGAAGEHRADRADGALGGVARAHGLPGALHDQERAAKTAFVEAAFEPDQIIVEPRRHHGAHHGGDVARIFADARADQRGEADIERGRHLADDGGEALFVRRIAEAPQERDGERLDALVQKLADGAARLRLVERHDDAALVVDALVDLANEALGDERRRLVGAHHRLNVLGIEPGVAARQIHDGERIAVAAGGEKADLGDVAGDERVERGGGAVRDVFGLSQQIVPRHAEILRQFVENIEHALGVIVRRRRCLGADEMSGAVGRDGVGKSSADVDPDQIGHVGYARILGGLRVKGSRADRRAVQVNFCSISSRRNFGSSARSPSP